MKKHAKKTQAELQRQLESDATDELRAAVECLLEAKRVVLRKQAEVERRFKILAATLEEGDRILGR